MEYVIVWQGDLQPICQTQSKYTTEVTYRGYIWTQRGIILYTQYGKCTTGKPSSIILYIILYKQFGCCVTVMTLMPTCVLFLIISQLQKTVHICLVSHSKFQHCSRKAHQRRASLLVYSPQLILCYSSGRRNVQLKYTIYNCMSWTIMHKCKSC